MLKRSWQFYFLAALLTATCAHKAPPIAKDRLSPRLSKVAVINTRQVQLTFTEAIDTVALTPDNVVITSANETLGVLLLYPSLSASEIIIVTQPMKDVSYQIQGQVLDKAENMGLFTARIQGSIKPDTISPWITGYSQGRNKYEFILDFSEAMDTTKLSFSIVPRKNFVMEWLSHRRVRFLPASPTESLAYDTTYYLYLKTASDISNNVVKPFITSVTPDTTHISIALRGKALIDNEPAENGLALLARGNILGIASVTRGEFAFMVRDSLYFDVLVASGPYFGRGRAAAGEGNIIELKKEHVDIDTLID